ncbi:MULTISPECIES: AI-2E family transporter [Aphanizomenonaceae]|uniref:AI-2E family transporter n=1 Tax=Dolichospermum heterosporum TAC447 TaxID=747523 RepID=A0ABY5LYL1_9CYAN|nr:MULTISPECIES: AI-2E family transporter [Aphanizomenonaceae]MBE9257891.1 AI-2E family transporter [Dolichospermum sp. LEGE 00246]MDK2410531.1 AI-2E family transporter [Aphanizomenon sp. 202]MDK2460940.1 AI-2E family transporter [Aphanizomenon sp. PH219]UUO17118.1 AI-2E family transporter [Dolichospermum heterosporum TAC447]
MQTRKLLNWWQTLTPIARFLAIALLAPLLVLNGWAIAAIFNYFHSLIVILVGASVLAFLLSYPVSWMENHGAKREQVAILVFLLALSILLALGVTLFPLALTQAQQLVARLPDLIDSGRSQLMILNEKAEGAGLPINLDALAAQINDRVKGQLQAIAGQVLNLAVITVTSLLDFLLTMVLTFYLLQHGGELWQSLVEWLPAKFRAPFSQTVRLSFQNFFITQLILSTCMASALIPTFLWLKVPFGLLFGLTIGVMALIPFGGSVGIALTTSLVSLQDVSMGVRVLIAAIIVQQILENLIAPRILGSFTGLNPVWILISVLTGARIGGLLGVIVAVPCAVVIKSIINAIRPSTLNLDTEDSHPEEISAPMTPEASPKIEPNNSLSVS